jgi:hypothetical protein
MSGVIRMDEPIRVETKMTYDDFKKFSWFNVLKRGRHLRPAIIILFAALALALASFAMMAADVGFETFIETSGVCMLILILFIPAYFLLLSLMFRLSYKRANNILSSRQRFEFSPDSLRIETEGQAMTGNTEAGYETLHRAFETQGAFYLYINKMQAFLLPKRDMDGQTAERLARLLGEKLGKKYVKCFRFSGQ